MGVDDRELVVVVLIRVGARRVRVALVLVVIHAGVLRAAVLALMSETERVADLLAYHVLLLGQVHRVGIIHLRNPLRDVAAAEPDLREAEPAIEAVGIVT